MAVRVLLTLFAAFLGWVAGVYAYFGTLWLIKGSVPTGGIHVGALPAGCAGMGLIGVVVWRWSARLSAGK